MNFNFLKIFKRKKPIIKDWITCNICDGTGVVYFGKKCPVCHGGKIIRPS